MSIDPMLPFPAFNLFKAAETPFDLLTGQYIEHIIIDNPTHFYTFTVSNYTDKALQPADSELTDLLLVSYKSARPDLVAGHTFNIDTYNPDIPDLFIFCLI